MTVLIDGLAIYSGILLSMKAEDHFRATARIKQKTSEQYRERAYAWYIVAVIGMIGCVATIATGCLLSTGQSALWLLLGFAVVVIVGVNSGNDADKRAI